MIGFDKEALQAFRDRLGDLSADPTAMDSLVAEIAEKQRDAVSELRSSDSVEDMSFNQGQLDLIDFLVEQVDKTLEERGITG